MPAQREATRGPSAMLVSVELDNSFHSEGDTTVETLTFSGEIPFTRVPMTDQTAAPPNVGSKMRVCGDTKPLDTFATFLLKAYCSPCNPCFVEMECYRSIWVVGGANILTILGTEIYNNTVWGRVLVGYEATSVGPGLPGQLIANGDPEDSEVSVTREQAGTSSQHESQIVTFTDAGFGGIVTFEGSRKLIWRDPDEEDHYFIVSGAVGFGITANQPRVVVTDSDWNPISTPGWIILTDETYGVRFTWVGKWGFQSLELLELQEFGMGESLTVVPLVPVFPKVKVWFQYYIQGVEGPSGSDDPPSNDDLTNGYPIGPPADPTFTEDQESLCPTTFVLSKDYHFDNGEGTVQDLEISIA